MVFSSEQEMKHSATTLNDGMLTAKYLNPIELSISKTYRITQLILIKKSKKFDHTY